VAVVDGTGKYLASFVIYLHEAQRGKEKLAAAARQLGVDAIAIGNGTASRETEQLVAEVIAESEERAAGSGERKAGAGSGRRRGTSWRM